MAVIFAFGDSITYGSKGTVSGGWCTLLRNHVDQKNAKDPNTYIRLYNLGIPGEATDTAVKRFLPELNARGRRDEEYIFIIAFGANDACFIPSRQELNVSVEDFTKNIQQMVGYAKDASQKIVLLNITPVVDELTVSPVGKDRSRINKRYEAYNKELARIAKDHDLTFIDVNSAFTSQDYRKLLSDDGLHPNDNGHQLMFDLISEQIDKFLSNT